MKSKNWNIRNISSRFAALTILGALAFTAAANADEQGDALLKKVQANLQAAPSLTADFTTTTLYPTYYRDTKEVGKVTLSKSGFARIEIDRYRKPERADEWQASGNSSITVSDGNTQTTLTRHPFISQIRKAQVRQPDSVLANLEPLQGFFSAERLFNGEAHYAGVHGAYQEIDLIPSADESGRDRGLRKLFIGDDSLIHRILIERESRGEKVTREIVLENIRRGEAVDESIFIPEIPANTTSDATSSARSGSRERLAVGTVAPEITVQDKQGREVHLADFKGKVVVLKFFATWCATCRQSLPDDNDIAKKYGAKDVVVLAVDILDSPEGFADWLPKNEKLNAIQFAFDAQLQSQDPAAALFHVSATPTEFVIGKDGKIAASFAGYNGPNADLENAIVAALTP